MQFKTFINFPVYKTTVAFNQLIIKKMKYLILIALLNLSIACGNPKAPVQKTVNNDKLLKSINDSLQKGNNKIIKDLKKTALKPVDETYYEDSIEEAILKMFTEKDLKYVDAQLALVEKDSKITLQDKRYWTAYLLYNKSMFYRGAQKDDDKASKTIDLAIETLNKNTETSENLALLAACKSFSIQFANMTQLAKIAAEVVEDANKSLEINPKNIRAYYVLTSNNFYTPKMFGGMTQVEEFALKGLACPNSADEGFYSPYWAKPRIYSLYIKYLEGENRKDDALKYKEIAKKEFPNQF